MTAIELENISKRYRLYPSNKARLKEAVSFGRIKGGRDFWALKDVNLKIEPGTSLGLLGRNGAGKSTLLQIISGVLQPTGGTVSVRGRISALLQLGAGFKPEFTGRENAVMNGLLLGIDRREMLDRLDEISAFADIGEFMDQPVKSYSSGMRARLGFAVAVNVDPEILLVDEALSVGDGVFRHTGIRRMRELQESGATVIFVSHSASQVMSFCNAAALLHKGRLLASGEAREVVDEYNALLAHESADSGFTSEEPDDDAPSFKEDPALKKRGDRFRHGSGEASIQNVEVLDERGTPTQLADPNSPMTVRIHARFAEDVEECAFDMTLRNRAGLDIFSTGTRPQKAHVGKARAGDVAVVDFTFVPTLQSSSYSVAAGISANGSALDWIDVATTFKIGRPEGRKAYSGLVHLPTEVNVRQPEQPRNAERPA